jgi:hypothetical protein
VSFIYRFICIYLGCNETDMFKIDLFVMLNLQKIQLLHNDICRTIVADPFQDSFQLICVFFLNLVWYSHKIMQNKVIDK